MLSSYPLICIRYLTYNVAMNILEKDMQEYIESKWGRWHRAATSLALYLFYKNAVTKKDLTNWMNMPTEEDIRINREYIDAFISKNMDEV